MKGKITLIVLIFLILVISGCVGKQLSFETIYLGGLGGVSERGDYVINSQEEWSELFNKTRTPYEIPTMDFSKNTVIAVFMGARSTGGHTIKITNIVEMDDKVIVYVKEGSPGPGEIVTMAFTYPNHIVKTQKITKEVIFQR